MIMSIYIYRLNIGYVWCEISREIMITLADESKLGPESEQHFGSHHKLSSYISY